MNVKTRLFSVILLGILVLPVFFNPPKSGNVLGVNEKKPNETTTTNNGSNTGNGQGISVDALFNTNNNSKPVQDSTPETSTTQSTNEYKLKDISSGIRDIKKKITSSPKTISGRVVWDVNNKTAVTSDKFSLGSGLKVKHNETELNVVVGDSRILAPDVLLSVDQKTFKQLGGDLEKQTSIDVNITTE
jgi:hypothetical protein